MIELRGLGMIKNVKAIIDDTLSTNYDVRYVLIDTDTGELLDNAQGYGYKSAQKAYAAYAYKNRDKSKDKEKRSRYKHIRDWINQNKSVISFLETIEFEIAKGSWGHDDKFDADLIKQVFKENNIDVDFTIRDFLHVWRDQ